MFVLKGRRIGNKISLFSLGGLRVGEREIGEVKMFVGKLVIKILWVFF